MTEIERKALELVNEVETERGMSEWTDVCRSELTMGEALCRAIERHEAFRQEVSDAVEALKDWPTPIDLRRFIITKPDPLVEAMRDACGTQGLATKHTPGELTEHLRAALAKRGLEIREKSE